MARTINIPARVLRQEIRRLEEYPPTTEGGPGCVGVMIGTLDEKGNWVESQPGMLVQIDGKNYEELCSVEPPEWAPDKPAGTYRNEDVWYFVDKLTAES